MYKVPERLTYGKLIQESLPSRQYGKENSQSRDEEVCISEEICFPGEEVRKEGSARQKK